jgi:hypothetical protein
MTKTPWFFPLRLLWVLLLLATCSWLSSSSAQTTPASTPKSRPRAVSVCANCVRAHEEFLASDALRGRGSGTPDELLAATYVAAQLRAYGIKPAGDDGGYIQRATLLDRKVTAPPELRLVSVPDHSGDAVFIHGRQMLVLVASQSEFSGKLLRLSASETQRTTKFESGTVVFLSDPPQKGIYRLASQLAARGAVALMLPASAEVKKRWDELGRELPQLPSQLAGEAEGGLLHDVTVLALDTDAASSIAATPDGAGLRFTAHAAPAQTSYTWNALGKLDGSDPQLKNKAVLLSAHLDHLGIGVPVNGDSIYNGADDDASGTTAVLELARVLGHGPRPRRTVVFALFGSEETGGMGSAWFRDHPPIPLHDIAVNLEFEMIGRSDPAIQSDQLWLTGWERSNLGASLAAHGAKLVRDPHRAQDFFARSDNYVLAKTGVVAQTVSSYGLHSDYHQPSDDIAHLDFRHMNIAIASLIGPVQWLVNSSFVPRWNPGGKP